MIQSMDSPDYSPVVSPPQLDTSRPSLGFPLGTGLLLIMIFSLSGVFSCCYHWDKLRSFRRSFSDAAAARNSAEAVSDQDADKAKVSHPVSKENKNESLPVVMPGDKIAKFIAMPCPCQPPRLDTIVVQQDVQKPPKPPRIAVPLY